jgi:hypothetical protein
MNAAARHNPIDDAEERANHGSPCNTLRDHLSALVNLAKDVGRTQAVVAGGVAMVLASAIYLYTRQDNLIDAGNRRETSIATISERLSGIEKAQAKNEMKLDQVLAGMGITPAPHP